MPVTTTLTPKKAPAPTRPSPATTPPARLNSSPAVALAVPESNQFQQNSPLAILNLQRGAGNQAVSRLVQRSLAPAPTAIQRALDPARTLRLKNLLGAPKLKKVTDANLDGAFDKLPDNTLQTYKSMSNVEFNKIIKRLEGEPESKWAGLMGLGDNANTAVDVLTALVDTGEKAQEISQGISGVSSTLGGIAKGLANNPLVANTDTALEKGSGVVSGMKDTYEGGKSLAKQKKVVEGGMGMVSGISGLVSLIPGVPDAVGMVSSGAKTLGGVTKMVNTRINHNAIERLKSDASAIPAMVTALTMLDNQHGYGEGIKQTTLGALETGGNFLGAYGKWGTTLLSKSAESLYKVSAFTTRAIASSLTSSVDSNAQVNENQEKEKAANKIKIHDAVLATQGSPEFIGRLHRLCVLIEPDFAEVIDRTVNSLSDPHKTDILKAIQLKNTWNPE